ncbi:hypothetical protein Q3G72_021187 [Acer saccharum]|nr:hypothetical protein Q3G72_021187 [Acer saccharum]
MKEATEANISDAVSSKIEKPDAGSKSYNNKGESTAPPELTRWFLINGEIRRGRRFMSNDLYGEGKENKSNPAVSSKARMEMEMEMETETKTTEAPEMILSLKQDRMN